MTQLGHGLFNVGHHEEAVSVREAELSMEQRLGGSEDNILSVQGNLAGAYYTVGRFEEALSLRRDVYAGTLKLYGQESFEILREANNYAVLLKELKHFTLATSVLRKSIRVARRVLGENHTLTLTSRSLYAQTILHNPSSTLDEIREAINTLEEMEPIARRTLGIAHPIAVNIQSELQKARALLRAREAGKNVVFVRE
jgi:tetratricopeptide (TPR) repeat protein